MISTLETMSGKTHKSYISNKTVTRDVSQIFSFKRNEEKVSYQAQTSEVPVISYNDMAFIAERNSIVFRAGDSPIWNKNETILPMSWRLFKDTIREPGKEFSLQTIPTLSSVLDFDLKANQPDFLKMLEKRIDQSLRVADVQKQYNEAFGYSESDVARLDIDVYADDIMRMVVESAQAEKQNEKELLDQDFGEGDMFDEDPYAFDYEENTEQVKVNLEKSNEQAEMDRKRYANGQLSKNDVRNANYRLQRIFMDAYAETRQYFTRGFQVNDGSLCSMQGTPYITYDMDQYLQLKAAGSEEGTRVFVEGGPTDRNEEAFGAYEIHQEFLNYLAELPDWHTVSFFEEKVARMLADDAA